MGTIGSVTMLDVALEREEDGDVMLGDMGQVDDNAPPRGSETERYRRVLRRKRGPRYFDPGERNLGVCFNCGEEGHAAVNCTLEKRKKLCFVCGMFGHNARHCTQGQDCFICERRGHTAKNCQGRNKCTPQDSIICLRCGDIGHDMLSCKNDCAPDDLKEIQCYVCKNYGHLCCVDFVDNCPREVFCYNCAQSGHTGLECAKPRGEMTVVTSPTLCYKFGEEGHFAQGCTKNVKVPPMPSNGLGPAAPVYVVPHQPRAEPNNKGGAKKASKTTKIVQSAYCGVCNIDCTTQEVLNTHKQGKKHKKNLQKLPEAIKKAAPVADKGDAGSSKRRRRMEAQGADLKTKMMRILGGGAERNQVMVCTICNVIVNSQTVYDSHITGSKHVAMVKKQQEAPEAIKKAAPVADKGDAGSSKRRRRMEAQGADLKTKMMRILGGGAERNQVMVCTICNVIVNSQTVYDSHITGSKHTAMVKKQQEAAAS